MHCIPYLEMWLSLVERCVRDAEVAGSNPVISTIETYDLVGKVKALTFVSALSLIYKDCSYLHYGYFYNKLRKIHIFIDLLKYL